MRTAGTSPEPFYFFRRNKGVKPLKVEFMRITNIIIKVLKKKDTQELLFLSVILDAFARMAQNKLQDLLNQENI
jgi:hypothetical protein